MRRLFRRFVVILCSAALVACTSLRTLVDANAPQVGLNGSVESVLLPNDTVTVTTKDGFQVQIQVTVVTPVLIEGIQSQSRQPTRIQLSEVAKIERREFDGAKTALLVVVIAAGVYAIAKAAATAALVSNL